MKGNKQNLSNEAAKSVAGGGNQKYWDRKQKECVRSLFDQDNPGLADRIFEKYTPKTWMSTLRRSKGLSYEKLSELAEKLWS